MLDTVIKNGRIVDGTGNSWFFGNVGIKDGMITHIGSFDMESRDVINAKGQIVSPGFIDGHSHSDLLVLKDPYYDIKLQQGVTTEVVGNCGLAPAPYFTEKGSLLKEYVEPIIGKTDWDWPWTTVKDYIDTVHQASISENIATYVAHGALRIAVMGFKNRPPTKEEMDKMKGILDEGMRAGAIGLSIGLLYSPGRYATKEEIAELCTVLRKYDGILATHIRGEGNNLIPSIKEVIWMAEKSGVSLQVSHLKAAGRRNWGGVFEAISMIEDARARGMDITCDVYPYDAGSTSLTTLLPPWSLEGGIQPCLERLRNKRLRNRIKSEMSEEQEEWDNLVVSTGWDHVVVSTAANFPQYEGMSIEAISKIAGNDPVDTALDLLLHEQGNVSIVYYHMASKDVEKVIQWDYSLIISDSLGCEVGKPHPRTYGSFPRLLSKYVREMKTLTLEQAIRKVTSFPAQRFKLGKRGLLIPGYQADITIFNQETINDLATYEDPIQYPDGISHVFVSGIQTIHDKRNVKKPNGDIIRASRFSYCCGNHS